MTGKEKQELIKTMLSHKLGMSTQEKVYGRNTYIEKIPKWETEMFCNQNHIQGYTTGTYYIGLKEKQTNKLVAVSIWRKEKTKLYLDRYCTNKNVIGGMGKIIKHIKEKAKKEGYKQLITFSNNEISNGNLYQKTGFKIDTSLNPDYSYVYKGTRKHKFNFRVKNFKSNPELIYKDGLSEKDLAEINGLQKIWDCGKIRWIIDL